MRSIALTALKLLFVAGIFVVLPAAPSLAQECTGADCPPPGGHQCERKEAPTA